MLIFGIGLYYCQERRVGRFALLLCSYNIKNDLLYCPVTTKRWVCHLHEPTRLLCYLVLVMLVMLSLTDGIYRGVPSYRPD